MTTTTISPGDRFGRWIVIGLVPVEPCDENTVHPYHCICNSCGAEALVASLYTVPGDDTTSWQCCYSCREKELLKHSFRGTLRKWNRFMSEGKSSIACKQLAGLLKRWSIRPKRFHPPFTRRRGYSLNEVMSKLRPSGSNSHSDDTVT
jgi:hypothetical protein